MSKRKRSKEATELLKLLNTRSSWNKPPFRAPRFNPGDLLKIREAADRFAQAHKSDPFARSRIHRHMRDGIQSAAEVLEEANRLLSLRPAFDEAA